jgi:hypothetical protein
MIPAEQGSLGPYHVQLRLQKNPQRGTLSFQLGQGFSLNLPHPFMTQMEIKTDLA